MSAVTLSNTTPSSTSILSLVRGIYSRPFSWWSGEATEVNWACMGRVVHTQSVKANKGTDIGDSFMKGFVAVRPPQKPCRNLGCLKLLADQLPVGVGGHQFFHLGGIRDLDADHPSVAVGL